MSNFSNVCIGVGKVIAQLVMWVGLFLSFLAYKLRIYRPLD